MSAVIGAQTSDAIRFSRATMLGVSTIHEASGGHGALPTQIHSIVPGFGLVGRAVTVSGPGADNLWLHRGLTRAGQGDVLVVRVADHYEAGYWGEVLSWAARIRGIAGVVIDGCARDADRLASIGVPVYARGLCIKGTTKMVDGVGAINEPIVIGDVTVSHDDLVVGDGDGVVVVAADRVDEVLRLGVERMEREAEVVSALQRGASTISLLGLPLEQEQQGASGQ